MYVVYLNGKRFSAWKTASGAYRQRNVLELFGYKNVTIDFVEGMTYEDGHEFEEIVNERS